LNFIVPMAITGGYVLDVLYRKFEEPLIPLALALGAIAFLGYEINLRHNWYLLIPLVLALAYILATFHFWTRSSKNQGRVHFYLTAAAVIAVCGAQMFALNFVHYDDDRYTYVYAHTRRDLLALVDEVNRIAARSAGADTGVTIVSPDYWPLPWYFRDLKRVGYFAHMSPSTEPVIIGSLAKEADLRSTFGDRYQQIRNPATSNGSYALRPGVDLLLYVRRDLAR
jgi:predicted membrane-bound mannosyltransferase